MSAQRTFLANFTRIQALHAERPAIAERGQIVFTYQELQARALLIAARLIQQGVSRESVVGLALEKSADYIAALLGTWFSGAAFVPLDPQLPPERLEFIIKETGMKVALVQHNSATLPGNSGVPVISLDSITSGNPPAADAWPQIDDLAYVIFTSGSTGIPKGVEVTHRGIVNFLEAQIQMFALTNESRSLFYLSTSFDASISDIGTALLSGACLCIEEAHALQPGADFIRLLKDRQITHIDIPPSVLRLLNPADMPESMKTIIIGGEVCPPPVVRQWSAAVRLVNVYGPTEATVCTSMCLCDIAWSRPLIGSPIPGVTYHLLDDRGMPAKKGTPAELHIAGRGLARGYINRRDLTEGKFVTIAGTRMYRTSDLVVEHDDGSIEFLGRVDRQLKVRGMLVEPEEIESRIVEHESVQEAAVVKRKLHPKSQRDVLVAFVVPRRMSVDFPSLNEHLRRHLPRWMVPQRLETVETLPRTLSGKVDLTALREMPLEIEDRQTSDSHSGTTALLIDIWKEVLAVASVDVHDDFFEIGGDSFAVLEVVALSEARGLNLSPAQMMRNPTIAGLIRDIEAAPASQFASGAMSCADIRADITLNQEWIELVERAKARPPYGGQEPNDLFLTGATGFLGARLLDELLRSTFARIHCLVRADDERSARQRIDQALALHGKHVPSHWTDRIVPVPGTLEKHNFGLSPERWLELANTIAVVYHCAAHVNMLLPYDELRQTNVGGTFEIARLILTGCRKQLHYASTLSVFVATDRNHGNLSEADDLSKTEQVWGGYAQTKWAAEVLLRSFGDALGPVSHYRFGLITADSLTGAMSPTDFLAMFVRGVALLGCVPSTNHDVTVDITPVDYAASAMARLSLQRKQSSATYHIANPTSLTLAELLAAVKAAGVTIKTVSPDRYLTEIAGSMSDPQAAAACLALCRCLPSDESFHRLRMLDLFQATDCQFEMNNTLGGLSGSQIACPPPSPELLRTYVASIIAGMANRQDSPVATTVRS